MDQAVEAAVIKNATDFPAYGQARTSNELRKLGYLFPHPACDPSGCVTTWPTTDRQGIAEQCPGGIKNRLKALEAKVAEEGGILTEAQVQALEKKKLDDEACVW